jgi:hypothetical protein
VEYIYHDFRWAINPYPTIAITSNHVSRSAP